MKLVQSTVVSLLILANANGQLQDSDDFDYVIRPIAHPHLLLGLDFVTGGGPIVTPPTPTPPPQPTNCFTKIGDGFCRDPSGDIGDYTKLTGGDLDISKCEFKCKNEFPDCKGYEHWYDKKDNEFVCEIHYSEVAGFKSGDAKCFRKNDACRPNGRPGEENPVPTPPPTGNIGNGTITDEPVGGDRRILLSGKKSIRSRNLNKNKDKKKKKNGGNNGNGNGNKRACYRLIGDGNCRIDQAGNDPGNPSRSKTQNRQKCERICTNDDSCQGYEYNADDNSCENHPVLPVTTQPKDSVVCRVKVDCAGSGGSGGGNGGSGNCQIDFAGPGYCRDRNDGKGNPETEKGMTLEECKEKCLARDYCTGYEFGFDEGKCETHITDIAGVEQKSGRECYRKTCTAEQVSAGIFDATADLNQRFLFPNNNNDVARPIINQKFQVCLTATDDDEVIFAPCNNSPQQQWAWGVSDRAIYLVETQSCIAFEEGTDGAKLKLQFFDCDAFYFDTIKQRRQIRTQGISGEEFCATEVAEQGQNFIQFNECRQENEKQYFALTNTGMLYSPSKGNCLGVTTLGGFSNVATSIPCNQTPERWAYDASKSLRNTVTNQCFTRDTDVFRFGFTKQCGVADIKQTFDFGEQFNANRKQQYPLPYFDPSKVKNNTTSIIVGASAGSATLLLAVAAIVIKKRRATNKTVVVLDDEDKMAMSSSNPIHDDHL